MWYRCEALGQSNKVDQVKFIFIKLSSGRSISFIFFCEISENHHQFESVPEINECPSWAIFFNAHFIHEVL